MNKKIIKNKVHNFLKKCVLNENLDLSFITPEVLNEVLKGYLICALWTEEERLNDEYQSEHPNPDDEYEDDEPISDLDKLIKLQSNMNSKTFQGFITDDLDVDSKIQAYVDIKTFIKLAGSDAVKEALLENGPEQLGHDLWLTRNRHGAGFFDRNYDSEEILMKAAHTVKEVDLYISDSGKLIFSNAH